MSAIGTDIYENIEVKEMKMVMGNECRLHFLKIDFTDYEKDSLWTI